MLKIKISKYKLLLIISFFQLIFNCFFYKKKYIFNLYIFINLKKENK